jgi:2-C-methyl-D-erythritol 4-phosphate cytidylyltransferase/2-C-methyl-D-erythritol 2,4-cyclodiphosphate synthase
MTHSPSIGVIIVAAGAGQRFGGDTPKQWKPLAGKSPVERSWHSFSPNSLVKLRQLQAPSWIGIVVNKDHVNLANTFRIATTVAAEVVLGGATRRQSVANALFEMPQSIDVIAIHDAVRPFWPQSKWDELVDACRYNDGAILAVAVSDTLKNHSGSQTVTVDRRDLWLAQTPQLFRADILREAHRQAERTGVDATDDADLVERAGGRVEIIPSTTTNIKITTPDDWELALRIAEAAVSSPPMRVGTGYDTHRLGGDGPLMLGGVQFAASGGLIGHSDGDALLHAICDALLGAAALGDIGQHFPPSDARFAGVSSRHLVTETVAILRSAGYRPVQVDATVLAERPKIMPRALEMRELIARDLGLDFATVSVKATTNESMGFIGRGEGIAAMAIATIAPL